MDKKKTDHTMFDQLWSIRTLSLLVVFVVGLVGCSNDSVAERLQTVLDDYSGEERLVELLRLEQEFPNDPAVDVEVAKALVGAGRDNEAEVYVDAARKGLRRSTEQRVSVEAYLLAAVVSFARSDFEQAVAFATDGLDAIGNSPSDEIESMRLPLFSIRARASTASGDHDVAIADYERAIELSSEPLSADVLLGYVTSLRANDRSNEALSQLQLRNYSFGYDYEGILSEVAIYERQGRPAEALLTLAIYFDGIRHEEGLSPDEAVERFGAIAASVEGQAEDTVLMIEAFFRSEWDTVDELIDSSEISDSHPMFAYLSAVCESQISEDPQSIGRLAELEPWFRHSQGYYSALWHAARRVSNTYSFGRIAPVLERTILLAPDSPSADLARREIATLVGIGTEDADSLLLREEIDSLSSNAISSRDASFLSPVFELLSLPDNRYTTYAMVTLGSLTRFPWIRDAVEARWSISSGRLRERLRSVLST